MGKARSQLKEGGLWGAGRKCGEGTGQAHFFTGIFPSGLSCILSFTRLVGQKARRQARRPAHSALRSKARHLHLVQEGGAGGVGCQRVLGQGQDIFCPVLQDPRAQQSGP